MLAASWDRSCDIILGQDPCLWSNFSVCTRKLGMPGSPVTFNKKRTSVGSKSQHYGAITSTLPDLLEAAVVEGRSKVLCLKMLRVSHSESRE